MLFRSFTAFISLSLFCVYSALCASPPENDAAVPAVLSSVLEVGALAAADDCQRSCFPALNFTMPTEVPSSLDGWWCSMDCEHAFLGFSYEVTACQSLSQLNADFADMRKNFNARYVRLYGACDQSGFYDDVIEAAWQNTLGVHALIWFGFTGGNEWETRRDDLFNTLHNNTKAPFVTRGVQFGSEPLYDDVLSHESLTEQVVLAKILLSDVLIPVTVSELAYGYQERGALDVLDQLDFINAHMLPFFSTEATTGSAAWPLVQQDMDWFIQNGNGKKMYFDENGWPSSTSSSVQANSPNAVASVSSEEEYFQMLDSQCETLKEGPCGGIGWFAHIYSDQQEAGYGIYNTQGTLKFPFQPRTSC
ncbi:glycoside hydrolase family 17 protein [Pisolithus croceorrhizus]|nr:glycoside hydrolase family 17 protein [Pisolithus croceorrhizus]KAI6107701.1 glycoside hydrolase family 17 protein [Pisolithus croceorrhizus]KAI6161107.1 glycoside hydrolase family 17 protein [Pisolithus thermaeus]